jgi:hypothetical protein
MGRPAMTPCLVSTSAPLGQGGLFLFIPYAPLRLNARNDRKILVEIYKNTR